MRRLALGRASSRGSAARSTARPRLGLLQVGRSGARAVEPAAPAEVAARRSTQNQPRGTLRLSAWRSQSGHRPTLPGPVIGLVIKPRTAGIVIVGEPGGRASCSQGGRSWRSSQLETTAEAPRHERPRASP